MSTLLKHFDVLTEKGLQVIPLRPNSKAPRLKKWSANWNKRTCRFMLQKYPYSNIGVLLGSIVDVEGDTLEANKFLLGLIGDYPHPTYCSAKSIHHLFLSPDPQLRILKHKGIEFRGHGHQSALPPSKCKGVQYMWLRGFKFPIPPMPEALEKYYWLLKKGGTQTRKKGFVGVHCSMCGNKESIHKKRLDLEIKAFKLWSSKWQCHKCRAVDIRPLCRKLKTQKPQDS